MRTIILTFIVTLFTEAHANDLSVLMGREFTNGEANQLCMDLMGNEGLRIQCGQAKLDKRYIISVNRDGEKVKITSTDQGSAVASWSVDPGPEQFSMAATLIKRHVTSIRYLRPLQEFILAMNIKHSSTVELGKDYEYHDKKTGKKLKVEEAIHSFTSEGPQKKNFWQASINIASILGTGSTWYWINRKSNSYDWEYDFGWTNYRKKLLSMEGVKFDSNMFDINAVAHPMTGQMYYSAARNNGFNSLESFLFSFTGSLLWEYFGEFKEKVSINDVIVTPAAGAVIGEVTYRMSLFLWSSGDSFVNKLFATVVDPIGSINRWINKQYPRRSKSLDQFGLNQDIFHEMRFAVGVAPQMGLVVLRANTKLINSKHYLGPGKGTNKLGMGDLTVLEIETMIGKGAVEQVNVLFQSLVGAIEKKDIEMDSQGRKEGFSVLAGFASGYSYNKTAYKDGVQDNMAIANIIGPHVEFHFFIKGFHLFYSGDASFDFNQIHSMAVKKVEDSGEDITQTKSILAEQKYYFAYGVTIRNRAQIEYKRLSVDLSYDETHARSIQGLDRKQDTLTDDFAISDSRSRLNVNASYRVYKNFRIYLGHSSDEFSGSAKGKSQKEKVKFYQVGIGGNI